MTEIFSTIVIAAAAVVTTGTTIALAFITRRYVRLTQESVRLTNGILKATYKPEIIVYLQSETITVGPHKYYYLNVCVENVGMGIARKVKFGGERHAGPWDGFQLTDIDFILQGIDALAPGREKKGSITNHRRMDYRPDDPRPLATITVKYKDSEGDDYNKEFILDFNEVDLPSDIYSRSRN